LALQVAFIARLCVVVITFLGTLSHAITADLQHPETIIYGATARPSALDGALLAASVICKPVAIALLLTLLQPVSADRMARAHITSASQAFPSLFTLAKGRATVTIN